MGCVMSFLLFKESKELVTLKYRPLTPLEAKKAEISAKFLIALRDFLKSRTHDEDQIRELNSQLGVFGRKIPAAAVLHKNISGFITAAESAKTARGNAKSLHNHLKVSSTALHAAFRGMNLAAMRDHTNAINTHMKSIDHGIDLSGEVDRIIRRIYIQPSFFGPSGRLMDSVSESDFDVVDKLDFSKQLYTSIPYPSSKAHDTDYLLYFLSKLSDNPKPRGIMGSHDFRVHMKAELANDENFAELKQITDQYLHENDKKLIPKIAELVEKIPSIKAANDKKKRSIKLVYRGLGFSDDSSPSFDDIQEHEEKEKFVATSTSRHAAKNFALQKGHLESDEMARASYSVILTYEVTPDCILFDTSVIDTAFNESEVVIDATKAELTSIDEVSASGKSRRHYDDE